MADKPDHISIASLFRTTSKYKWLLLISFVFIIFAGYIISLYHVDEYRIYRYVKLGSAVADSGKLISLTEPHKVIATLNAKYLMSLKNAYPTKWRIAFEKIDTNIIAIQSIGPKSELPRFEQATKDLLRDINQIQGIEYNSILAQINTDITQSNHSLIQLKASLRNFEAQFNLLKSQFGSAIRTQPKQIDLNDNAGIFAKLIDSYKHIDIITNDINQLSKKLVITKGRLNSLQHASFVNNVTISESPVGLSKTSIIIISILMAFIVVAISILLLNIIPADAKDGK